MLSRCNRELARFPNLFGRVVELRFHRPTSCASFMDSFQTEARLVSAELVADRAAKFHRSWCSTKKGFIKEKAVWYSVVFPREFVSYTCPEFFMYMGFNGSFPLIHL